MVLTELQIKLAEQLLLSVINKEPYVEYNELAVRVNPPIFWRQVGREIGEVSKLCHELGLPLLSAKVTNKGHGRAGSGFFDVMRELGRYDNRYTDDELLDKELSAIRNCTQWYKLADHLGLNLSLPRPHKAEVYPEELSGSTQGYPEGAAKQILINAYERNPAARKACIAIHGSKCAICGFDFASIYGADFEGLIHVHHIRPLHTLGTEYTVNPKTDLIPVCPNCHMALHAKADGVYSPEELQQKMKGAGK